MISKNIIFKYGHFYDRETNQRISLVENTTYCILGDESTDFEIGKPVGRIQKEKSISTFRNELEEKEKAKKIDMFKLIFDRNTSLFFEINIKQNQYIFEVKLLEELYSFKKKEWKNKTFRLYDCYCKVVNSTGEKIDYFEPVYGKSLNELYKNTYIHFFGNEGNPAVNALDRFYELSGSNNRITYIRDKCEADIYRQEQLLNRSNL